VNGKNPIIILVGFFAITLYVPEKPSGDKEKKRYSNIDKGALF
jgi:hypothetical protein